MTSDIERRAARLDPGSQDWGKASSTFLRVGSDAGAFRFERMTLGFVFRTLDRHEAGYGTDRRRTVPLGPGAGWLLPAGIDGHCAWDGPSEFINVSFEPSTLADVGLSDGGSVAAQYGYVDPTAVRIALDLHEAGDAPHARLYRDTMTLALAAHLARVIASQAEQERPVARPVVHDQRIGRVVDFIEQHLTEDLSLDALAAVAALSPFHFARSFKAALGEPPHRFVMRRRVERAQVLLRTTALPVAEVAYRVGWENVSHFTQAFRAMVGATPGQYRASL